MKLAPAWLVAIVTLLFVGAAAGLGAIAVDNRADDNARRPGTVTVGDCTYLHDNQHGAASYRCTGSFAAADGSFTVPSVELDHQGRLRAGDTVRAKAAGPGARTAVETDEVWYRFWVPLLLGVLLLGIVGYALPIWLRARLRQA